MNKKNIAIVGGIAVGKSTLLHTLSQMLNGYSVIEEDVSQNIFLSDFYHDMKRWSFHSRISTLAMIVENTLSPKKNNALIMDRCVDELITFAKMHYDEGNISAKEFAVYFSLYQSFVYLMPQIDYYIYCRCSVECSLRRIKKRNRPFEQGIQESYLKKLNSYYEKWIMTLPPDKVILLDTEKGITKNQVKYLMDQYCL